MSGLPRKLKKPMLPTGSIRPEDVAMKPRPPINAIGTNKRPIPMVPAQGVIPLTKKPRIDDASTSNLAAGSAQSVSRPLIDIDDLQAFAAKGKCDEIEEADFNEALNKAIEEAKYNKACRLIVAYLLKVIKISQTALKGSFDAEQITQLARVIGENAEKLTNVYMFKVLFWVLTVIKNCSNSKQALFIGMITRLAMDQQQLHPFLAQAFLADSLGERIWVEKPHSDKLVSMILKRFSTKFPPLDSPLYKSTGGEISMPIWIPDPNVPDKFPPNTDGVTEAEREKERRRRRKEKDKDGGQVNTEKEDETLPPVRINVVEDTLTILLRSLEQQSESPTRSLLRTLAVFSGLDEVRLAVATRIDNWLQNPKIQKQALELLFQIGVNIEDLVNNSKDAEVMGHLLRMKSLKNKQVQSVFNVFTGNLTSNAENCRVFTRELALNEFGPQSTRSANNMSILQAMFLHNNLLQTKVLAEEMCDILFERQDMIRAACFMIRELIRGYIRADFSFSRFLSAYLNRCGTRMFSGEHFNDETVTSTTISMCNLLVWINISQQVRDEFSKRRQGEAFNIAVFNRFSAELNDYYEIGIKWLRSVCSMLFNDKKDYISRLYSILFLDKGTFLMNLDGGPSEPEWAICQRIIAETHPTSRFISLIVSDPSLQPIDCIQILHLITERLAKNLTYADETLPFVDGLEVDLVDAVYDLARYKPRSGIKDQNLQLFIIDLFWRVTFVTFIWICFGTPSLLKIVHDKYPNLRLLMLIAMTENFTLPSTLANNIKADERLLLQEEEKLILDLEKSESKNPNLSLKESEMVKICFTIPFRDKYRTPPTELIASLGTFCKTHKIGIRLCENRSPDLLQEFIELVGTGEALYAITSFINRDSGAISTLSIESLCEFMILRLTDEDSISDDNWNVQKEKIFDRLTATAKTEPKVLLFILEKLAHTHDMHQRSSLLRILNITYFRDSLSAQSHKEIAFLQIISNLPYFSAERYSLLVKLARACKYEVEPEHLKSYLKFINDHIYPDDDFDQIVKILSPIGLKKDTTIKSGMLDLYLRYNNAMKNRTLDSSSDKICEVKFKKQKILLDYDVILAQIELLCSSSKADNSTAREELINMWFPEDGSKITVLKENKPLNIFTETLLANMLCTEDERIVNVALSDLSPYSALVLLRRFGLALNCASRLLAMLDQLNIDSVEFSEMHKTLPFVNGYRLRGAKGGDKFVQTIENKHTSVYKEESNESLICEPLPRLTPPPIALSLSLSDSKEIVNKMKTAISTSSELNFESQEVCSIYSSEKVALSCLELVEGSLKYLLEHPDTFLQIMLLLSSAAERFPSVQTQLSAWSTKVLKGAQPPIVVAGILRNFASNTSSDAKKKSNKNKLTNADAVLKILQEAADLNNAERSRLVACYLEFQPQIVEGGKRLEEQTEALFLSKNPTIGWLCRQLPQHCLPETLESILYFILSKYNSKLNSSSVLSFIWYCACEGKGLISSKTTEAQLNVLAHYLCGAVAINPNLEEKAVAIVVALESTLGPWILRPLIETCIRETRSALGTGKHETVERLISTIKEKYPCIKIDMICGLTTMVTVNWCAEEADAQATQLLTSAFKATSTNLKKVIDQLETLLRVYPKIMERQIGMLSRLLAQLVSMNSRDAKERMAVVPFSIRVLYQLIPVADQGSLEHIDALISVIISFAERHLLEKRGAINERETVLRTCLLYLDSHQSRAQSLLNDHSEAILKLCEGISDNYFIQQIHEVLQGNPTS